MATQIIGAPANTLPPVYTGVWTNWSYGKIRGSTLTLNQRDAAALTAFLALFIAYAGSLIWRIACLALHQRLSSHKHKSQSGLYQQCQVTLRNSGTAAAGFWRFSKLLWARRTRNFGPYRRLVPLILLAGVYWIIFTAASIFSSKISSMLGDEVLVSSRNCGRSLFAPDYDSLGQPNYLGMPVNSALRVVKSQDYVNRCYHNEEKSACDDYVKDRILFDTDWNASCPFDTSVCASSDQNIILDAFVNSHDDLGINTSPNERVDLHWRTHCGVLKTAGYKGSFNYSEEQSYVTYHYGKRISRSRDFSATNYTFLTEVRDFNRWSFEALLRPPIDPVLTTFSYAPRNGTTHAESTHFEPVEPIQSTDGETWLMFLTRYYERSLVPSEDPWYSSHLLTGSLVDAFTNATQNIYSADEESAPLACKAQFQSCEPGNRDKCSPFSSLIDAYDDFGSFDDSRSRLLLRLFQGFAVRSLGEIPLYRGAAALESPMSGDRVWYYMPPDQWKLDMVHIQSMFLAALQGSVVDAAVGTSNADYVGSIWKVTNESADAQLCQSQVSLANATTSALLTNLYKIRSVAYTNFSVLWLSLILGIGGLFILLEWSVEPFVSWSERRRNRHTYAFAEWRTNEVLQLHRLAHEELGYGIWSRCGDTVPLTEEDDKLALLDIDDPWHSKLHVKPSTIQEDTPEKLSLQPTSGESLHSQVVSAIDEIMPGETSPRSS